MQLIRGYGLSLKKTGYKKRAAHMCLSQVFTQVASLLRQPQYGLEEVVIAVNEAPLMLALLEMALAVQENKRYTVGRPVVLV